jgi:hypothetical protein
MDLLVFLDMSARALFSWPSQILQATNNTDSSSGPRLIIVWSGGRWRVRVEKASTMWLKHNRLLHLLVWWFLAHVWACYDSLSTAPAIQLAVNDDSHRIAWSRNVGAGSRSEASQVEPGSDIVRVSARCCYRRLQCHVLRHRRLVRGPIAIVVGPGSMIELGLARRCYFCDLPVHLILQLVVPRNLQSLPQHCLLEAGNDIHLRWHRRSRGHRRFSFAGARDDTAPPSKQCFHRENKTDCARIRISRPDSSRSSANSEQFCRSFWLEKCSCDQQEVIGCVAR